MRFKGWKWMRRLSILCWISFAYLTYYEQIPDEMYVPQGQTLSQQLDVPAVFLAKGQVRTHEAKEISVLPAGTNIGIYLKNAGVLVVDVVSVDGKNGTETPCEYKLFCGDRILSVNGQAVGTKEELIQALENAGEQSVCLGVARNEEKIEVRVCPVLCQDEICRLGIWVRDDIAGIGTLTYITKDGSFGALGHGVSDLDSGQLISMQQGQIYQTMLTGIKKGEKGAPGEISGVIAFSDQTRIGRIDKNLDIGIYGTVDATPDSLKDIQPVRIAYKQEIQKGKAYIISSVSGQRKAYEIMIDGIDYHASEKNKGILYHVVDEDLIAQTGGIIQGMSGSPIIQNQKLIGAVTHVFVKEPTKGYGIFIEEMIGQ